MNGSKANNFRTIGDTAPKDVQLLTNEFQDPQDQAHSGLQSTSFLSLPTLSCGQTVENINLRKVRSELKGKH